jgi:hypothetical protein
VCRLYLDPPANPVVWGLDDKSGMLAKVPGGPDRRPRARPGKPESRVQIRRSHRHGPDQIGHPLTGRAQRFAMTVAHRFPQPRLLNRNAGNTVHEINPR